MGASSEDLTARAAWGSYGKAYQDALGRCRMPHAPWFIIPANRKWFRNLAVSSILVEILEGCPMRFPKPTIDLAHYLIH